MSGVRPRFSHAGPVSYEVVEAVKGGRLIEARAAGKVGLAAVGSLKVLGVAEVDAKPVTNPVTTDADGFETINISPLPDHTAVGMGHYVVEYTANASFGDALVAAAGGKVAPIAAVTTPTPADVTSTRAIVGYCSEPAGVVIATTPFGLANISR